MTWGVFLLYASDYYPEDKYSRVKDFTIKRMEADRGFPRFSSFYKELYRLRQTQTADSREISHLFPQILDWCRGQG